VSVGPDLEALPPPRGDAAIARLVAAADRKIVDPRDRGFGRHQERTPVARGIWH